MTELGDSLERMNFMQLLLLFVFVTSYVLAIGALVGGRARMRFALLALAAAAGFAAMTDPWVHGALLVAFVVAALGGFVMLTWLLARWLAPRQAGMSATAVAESVPTPLPAVAPPHPEGTAAAPKLPRRARAAR